MGALFAGALFAGALFAGALFAGALFVPSGFMPPLCSRFRSRLVAAETDDAMMIRDRVTETRFRVRYAETDQMGFAHHSNHLVWFEVARLEFFRDLGLSYDRLERESQTFLPVVEIRCRYMKPLFYDREFVIRTRLKRLGRRGHDFRLPDRGSHGKRQLRPGGEPAHRHQPGRPSLHLSRLLSESLPPR